MASEMNLGDFLRSINESKENLIRKNERSESAAKKLYPAFVVARTLSYHIDCILFVNELNKLGAIDPLQHYEFLLYSIRKNKRFSKWSKPEEKSDVVNALQKIYGYSEVRAREAEKLLSTTEAESILRNVPKHNY